MDLIVLVNFGFILFIIYLFYWEAKCFLPYIPFVQPTSCKLPMSQFCDCFVLQVLIIRILESENNFIPSCGLMLTTFN